MANQVNPADLTRQQLLHLVTEAYGHGFSSYTEAELLRYVKKHPSSRFEKLLTSANVLKLIEKNRKDTRRAKNRAKKKPTPIRRVAGKGIKDPQYDIEVEFSEDGKSFSNPLDVKSNTTYQCRMRLRQHMGEFNAIGFALDWKTSGNLSFSDGYGSRTYEEAISNPLVISRLVHTGTISPNTTVSAKVVVAERYM